MFPLPFQAKAGTALAVVSLLVSSLSAQVTTPLADGTYRAYVRVGQTVNGVTQPRFSRIME